MKLAKRTETEVRDSLHDAIDRMSIMEIVVLIFLVQMIRTREFVSHILPKPRKMLPALVEETAFSGLDDLIATGCTDPELEEETSFSYAEYYEAVIDAIRNNKPYPPVPSFMSVAEYAPFDWEHVASAPLPPLPEPMFRLDANGRCVRVVGIQGQPLSPENPYFEEPEWVSGSPMDFGSIVDGGVAPFENARAHYEASMALCTPSRGQLTGYCTCPVCRASYESPVHVIPR